MDHKLNLNCTLGLSRIMYVNVRETMTVTFLRASEGEMVMYSQILHDVELYCQF